MGQKGGPELEGLVDHISISLNAGDPVTYQELCSSEYGERAHQAIIDFAVECLNIFPR